jgi:hypothetical protein
MSDKTAERITATAIFGGLMLVMFIPLLAMLVVR